ncbi:hypothetical protein NDU88_000267 [Pleurodeles waltl]|uniref:Uncharacterized protein n=1 Tax=Pleurodeles waltl TaxID=8319 RepID=A0AAV7LE56_PLEWA|nr:hypothetical protein NDU88_000267 [Pleurodeles waltl]
MFVTRGQHQPHQHSSYLIMILRTLAQPSFKAVRSPELSQVLRLPADITGTCALQKSGLPTRFLSCGRPTPLPPGYASPSLRDMAGTFHLVLCPPWLPKPCKNQRSKQADTPAGKQPLNRGVSASAASVLNIRPRPALRAGT